MRTRSQRYKALTQEEKNVVRCIPFIGDVDYIPEEKEVYEKLPEPFRTEALEELENRETYFDQRAAHKKESFA